MKRLAVYETCRVCMATQTLTMGRRKVPQMYRAGDGSVQCSDAVGCLARRRELIAGMEQALSRVWDFLDDMAVRAGWPR